MNTNVKNGQKSKQERGGSMVVNRYINGRKITEAELQQITISGNSRAGEIIARVVARINAELQDSVSA